LDFILSRETEAMTVFNGTAGRDILPFIPFSTPGLPVNLPALVRTATGNDVLNGLGGNDVLIGWQGNDVLHGGAGADWLIGGNLLSLSGGPWLLEAAGSDTADYSTSAIGVGIDLSIMHGQVISFSQDWRAANAGSVTSFGVVYGRGGDAQGDRLINITNLTGSGQNDFLGGNVDANVLRGGAGNDTLRGGAGADILDGGAGIDMADYSTASTGVIVDIAFGGGSSHDVSDADGDVLVGIERLRGSAFDDRLAGADGDDLLSGGAGNDNLGGLRGRDALFGGAGDDRITGGEGADYIEGDAGADTFIYSFDHEVGFGKADLIADFSSAEGDRIDLQGIAVLYGHAVFIGTAQFSGLGLGHPEVRAVSQGGQTSVFLDIDGSGSAYLQIRMTGAITLTAGDFVL